MSFSSLYTLYFFLSFVPLVPVIPCVLFVLFRLLCFVSFVPLNPFSPLYYWSLLHPSSRCTLFQLNRATSFSSFTASSACLHPFMIVSYHPSFVTLPFYCNLFLASEPQTNIDEEILQQIEIIKPPAESDPQIEIYKVSFENILFSVPPCPIFARILAK